MITDDRAEKALVYLVSTDEPCAMAQSHWEALHQLRHQVEGYSVKEKSKTIPFFKHAVSGYYSRSIKKFRYIRYTVFFRNIVIIIKGFELKTSLPQKRGEG